MSAKCSVKSSPMTGEVCKVSDRCIRRSSPGVIGGDESGLCSSEWKPEVVYKSGERKVAR